MDKTRAEKMAIEKIKEHFKMGAPRLLSIELKNKAWVARFEKTCPECGEGWYEVVIDDKTGKAIQFDESR